MNKLGEAITRNVDQAAYLGKKVSKTACFELMAPVSLNIVCFRYAPKAVNDLDGFNKSIVISLQTEGIAAPSTTLLNGQLAIRVNITNHRTENSDLDILLEAVRTRGDVILAGGTFS